MIQDHLRPRLVNADQEDDDRTCIHSRVDIETIVCLFLKLYLTDILLGGVGTYLTTTSR